MKCKGCQTDYTPGQMFCTECGAALASECVDCGQSLEANAKFCSNCGSAQSIGPEKKGPQPDRRPVTAFFCDLVGSTDLSTALDPEDLRDIIRQYQERAASVVSRFEGYLSRFMGDGILVFFGYPVAQEDAAERAVRAGLELVEEVGLLDSSQDVALQVRIGIATGEVVAGDLIGKGSAEEHAVVGETPNLAARLQSLAKPNQVVVAGSTYRLLRGDFNSQDLGFVELKGFPKPQRAWCIEGVSQEQSRFDSGIITHRTKLIGRQDEIQTLLELMQAGKAGNGQVAQVVGDAGIGKSRLIQEIRVLAAENGFDVAPFRCSPMHQNTPLYPIIQFFNTWLDVTENVEGKLEALEKNLKQMGIYSVESVALLASLLSISAPADRFPVIDLPPQSKRKKTHKILSECVSSRSLLNPSMLIWEDLHWADPSTLEVLTSVIANAEHSRQLHLLSFRPEFEPPWEVKSYLTDIQLRPLDEEQTKELIDALSENIDLPADFIKSLVQRSDGVPLFAEELAQMAIDASQVGKAPVATMEIPSTLHDSLVARLDRLVSARKIAQVGSVFGREFSASFLFPLFNESQVELERLLKRLVETQILLQKGTGNEATYRFRHALIQDAAYRTMLKKERREAHLQIANLFENDFAEIAASEPEVLAYHLTKAECGERAIVYWKNGGDKAQSRFDNVEAVHHYQAALDLIHNEPPSPEQIETELGLLLALGVPLTTIRGFSSEDVGAVYRKARDICFNMETNATLHLILNGLYRFYYVRGDLEDAHEVTERLMSLAEASGDSGQLLYANQAHAFTLAMQGKVKDARQCLEKVDQLYDWEKHYKLMEMYGADVMIAARTGGAASVLYPLGEFTLANNWSDKGLALAREQGNPFELAWALTYTGVVSQQFGRVADVLEKTNEGIDVSSKFEMPHWLAACQILTGWAHWRSGQVKSGLEEMRASIAMWRAIGCGIFLSYFQSLLLEALIEEQLKEEALQVYEDICNDIARTKEVWWLPEIERLRGELQALQEPDNQLAAAKLMQRAVKLAQSQGERALELRARTSLFRLDSTQYNRDELVECLKGLDQEPDTADLEKAKDLLASG